MTNNRPTAPGAHPSDQSPAQNGTPQREILTGFDPADWLARYTALGGVYVANGKLNLCILVNKQSEEELSQIRQMVVDLTDDDRAAILAHVASEPAYTPVTWRDVVTKYETDEAAFSRHPYARTHPDAPEHMALDLEHKALMVRSSESLRKLIETPAPDHAALCRKVEIIRKEYGDYEGLFSALLADIERLGRTTVRDIADRQATEA